MIITKIFLRFKAINLIADRLYEIKVIQNQSTFRNYVIATKMLIDYLIY